MEVNQMGCMSCVNCGWCGNKSPCPECGGSCLFDEDNFVDDEDESNDTDSKEDLSWGQDNIIWEGEDNG
jgi:hypothetical protein